MDGQVADGPLIRSGPEEHGIWRVRFNRPQKANALSAELAHELLDTLRALNESSCNGVVIEGEGKNFCAGFDFEGYETMSSGDLIARFVAIEQSLHLLRTAPFISVAVVRGAAFGAGADIVAACTYRLGSDRARFRFPGFQFGVALGTRHLARLVGMQKAREILLDNRVVDSEEALGCGLLTHREADDAMDKRAQTLVRVSASLEADAVRKILRMTLNSDPSADMADLINSLSKAGLHERIARYREASSKG
jgi:enoyl-CoA hydratase/carnithine racemase